MRYYKFSFYRLRAMIEGLQIGLQRKRPLLEGGLMSARVARLGHIARESVERLGQMQCWGQETLYGSVTGPSPADQGSYNNSYGLTSDVALSVFNAVAPLMDVDRLFDSSF
jgi:hypothetical protein